MNFNYLINRSWSIVRGNRGLWWLGLLSLSGGGMSWFTPGDFTPGKEGEGMSEMPVEVQQVLDQVKTWVIDHQQLVIAGALFLVVLLVLAVYIALVSRASLILAVNRAEEGKEIPGFGQAYVVGRPFAVRILLSHILAIVVVGLLVGLPVGFLIATNVLNKSTITGPIIVFALLAIAGMILLEILLQLSIRSIVLQNQNVLEGFRNGWRLLKSSFVNLILAWVVEVGLSIGIGILVALLAIPVIIFAVLAGVLSFIFLQKAGLLVYIALATVVIVYLLFLVSGLISAFFSAYWTLIYRSLTQPALPKK